MKRCGECNVIYEGTHDICPTCGDRLETVGTTSGGQSGASSSTRDTSSARDDDSNRFRREARPEPQPRDEYTFEQTEGLSVVINGAVAEANTQQFYQSKLTKIVRAVFAGEPYQLSHTSFVTIFRVEEHARRGYPEHARDISVFGNMNNIFTVGDDVTVRAKRSRNKYVAKSIYNHSINSRVSIQANIPAMLIRLLTLFLVFMAISLVRGVASADFAAIGTGLASFFMPLIIVVAIGWYIKNLFKRKK